MTTLSLIESDDLAHHYAEAELPRQRARFEALRARFRAAFGRDAEFVARSPGRVNLLGEHIDYCGTLAICCGHWSRA